jgi:hypothetical protein
MPTPLTPPALEVVLQGLHESEIRCGIHNEPPAGGITAWIDSIRADAMAYGQVERTIYRARLRDGRCSDCLCDSEGLANR